MASSVDRRLNISASVFVKRVWDLLGIILVFLQLSSHFVGTNSVSTDERRSYIYRVFSRGGASAERKDDNLLGFLNIHILVDLYFLIDVVVRISYSRCNSTQQTTKGNHLRTCWFVIDILLVFPHGFCWQLWQSRPALQLLSLRQGKRPIFEFFRNRDFRKKVFQLIKEHREEKRLFQGLKGLLLGSGSVIVAGRASPLSDQLSWLSWTLSFVSASFRRTMNFATRVSNSLKKYRNLKIYSCTVRWISWIAVSIRALYISKLSASTDDDCDDNPFPASSAGTDTNSDTNTNTSSSEPLTQSSSSPHIQNGSNTSHIKHI